MTGPGFSAPFRVRFDEAGADGLLRTSGLLRYTQDLAGQHSEALGYDRVWYASHGLSWLVRTAELDVLEPVPHGASLTGTTRVVGIRRVWSRRETTFELGDSTVAVVRIDWVLLDARGAPARIPPEFERIFAVTAPLPGTLQLARVPLGEVSDRAVPLSIDVRRQELDPLDHVNNAVYADWVDEVVSVVGGQDGSRAVDALPRRVRLEYALPAGPGERLEALTWAADNGWSCRVTRPTDGAELLRARVEPGPAPD